jgi:hypothetical protein
MTSTYEMIATTTLGSASASVTLSSIPSTYTDLVLVCNLTANTAPLNMGIRFNSDTSSLYSGTTMGGNGSTAVSTRYTGTLIGEIYASTSTTSGNQIFIMNIMNYSNTTTFKSAITRFNSTNYAAEAQANLYRSTSAINAVTVLAQNDSYATGSTFTLYGIKAE